MEEYKVKIKQIISELSNEFDKLIMANPYLLKVLSKTYKKNTIEPFECDYNEIYKKFKRHDIAKKINYVVLSFIIYTVVLAITYFLYKYNVLQYKEVKIQEVFSKLLPAIPVIFAILTIFLGFWSVFLRATDIKDVLLTEKFWSFLLFYVFIAIMTIYLSKLAPELLLCICPLSGCIILFFSFHFIYDPLSSRKLNDTIIEKTQQILNEFDSLNKSLDSINKSNVQDSHSNVLKRIAQVENTIIQKKDSTALSKLQSLTVLDSLRLELIKNSINGINLVKDWKFLDLSQKMMEEIMSDKNKKITILGDLSFLSTNDGLDKLVTAIKGKEKEIEIYFTGERDPADEKTIISNHCNVFVNNIRRKYHKGTQEEISQKVLLKPIPSESFTGIGFIGLRDNDDNNDNKVYKKVYAYISSLLLSEDIIDITRANPFVFSWDTKLTYFGAFLRSKMVYDSSLKVKIGNKSIPAKELLKFE